MAYERTHSFRLLVAPMLCLLATGCYTTAELTGPAAQTAIGVMVGGPHAHAINLRAQTDDGGAETARIAPQTSVRFVLKNGAETTWADAGDLSVGVGGVAVLATPRPDTSTNLPLVVCGEQLCERTVLPWSDVDRVELKNFDGPKSLFATVGTAGGMVALAAVAVALESSDNSAAQFAGTLVEAGTDVATNVGLNAAAANAPGGDPTGDLVLDDHGRGNVFTGWARRKSMASFVLSDETGLLTGRGVVDTLGLGLELGELFEVDGTLTLAEPNAPFLPASWRSATSARGVAMGYGGRAVWDLPMDAGRHVFLPLGVEFGTVHGVGPYLALDAELVFRLRGDVRLGLRPFNPDVLTSDVGYLNQITLRVPF